MVEMYFLTVKETSEANIFGEDYHLEPIRYPRVDPGQILISDDSRGIELLARHASVLLRAKFDATLIPGFPQLWRSCPSKLPENSIMIILKGGGIGDHIMFTPALRSLRKMMPESCELWLASEKATLRLFEDNPAISRLISLPVRMSLFMAADYYIDFSNASPNAYKEMHLTDYCLHSLNIDHKSEKDKQPFVPDRMTNSKGIREIFQELREQHDGKTLVFMQWLTSTLIRDVPPELLSVLPTAFSGCVFIVAHEKKKNEQTAQQINRQGMNVVNMSSYMNSLRDYVTAIKCSDYVVSGDTSACHIAAALKKPALTLFGPIGSELRSRYYPKGMSLDAEYSGHTCKAPCGLDRIWKDDLVEEGRTRTRNSCPEAKVKRTEYSPCLLSIKKEHVVESFDKLISSY